MRSSFVAFDGGLLLAADYSQLELRIIGHLANDEKLIDLLNCGGDVFRIIASQLSGCDVVDDAQRQVAKQVVEVGWKLLL